MIKRRSFFTTFYTKYNLNLYILAIAVEPPIPFIIVQTCVYSAGARRLRRAPAKFLNFKVSLIAARRSIGVGHGDKSRLKRRLQVILAECRA